MLFKTMERIRLRQRICVLFVALLVSFSTSAQLEYKTSFAADHFVYFPQKKPKNILVIAHGMLGKNQAAAANAKKYIKRWIDYAERYGLVVIAPVFDTKRFGNLGGGYGGYRNLFGKYIAADEFVNQLVDTYAAQFNLAGTQFYLYGHSAGGQFVNRYVVTHPDRVIRAVVSAAGRYSYPTKSEKWPYGAGDFKKNIKWKDGVKTPVSVSRSLQNYAKAASKVSVVIGGADTKPQPERPAHVGKTRIDLARSWAATMNKNASKYGFSGSVQVWVVPGVGHSSAKLTRQCAEVLFNR